MSLCVDGFPSFQLWPFFRRELYVELSGSQPRMTLGSFPSQSVGRVALAGSRKGGQVGSVSSSSITDKLITLDRTVPLIMGYGYMIIQGSQARCWRQRLDGGRVDNGLISPSRSPANM